MAMRDTKLSQASEGRSAIDGYERYAIYYAPREDEPLAGFGAAWLGRQTDGSDHPRIATDLAPESLAEMTRSARRYGLHGTLKAPFALARGATIDALDQALRSFAASRPAASWPGWRVSGAHGFTALRPNGPSPALDALAAGVVAQFAAYGAPRTPAELERRRRFGLSARQEAYLAAYGYPYVFEDFAFHVTLSGALGAADREALGRVLQGPLSEVLALTTATIRDLCLFGDPGGERPFVLLRRYALSPTR